MRKNGGFLNFFVFLIFLTYIFYLTYGFLKKRKEETNQVISTITIRKENFYNNLDKKEEEPNNTEVAPSEESAENDQSTAGQEEQQVDNNNQTNNTEPQSIKSYLRVATYNKKEDADIEVKKLGSDFRVRERTTDNGRTVYIINSKTVTSNDELDKLKNKAKGHEYQVIDEN